MTSVTDVVVIGAGQSGLAATKALQAHGISPLVLEARDRAAGSWPCYYDSLKAFSPAGFNSMPGMPFPGDPDRYPARDEVADYLDSYAAALGVEIHTSTRVATVRSEGREFVVVTADGQQSAGHGDRRGQRIVLQPPSSHLPRSARLHQRTHPCRRLP